MRIAAAIVRFYPLLLVAAGTGFLVWSFSQAGAADAYLRAPQCANGVTRNCYETFPGVITSVEVSQSRSGERDSVVLQTATAGMLTVTLTPSASAAPHVRTGANVVVKRYNGEVTLVEVDGYGVATTLNPAANRSSTSSAGWLLIALGLISGAVSFFLVRRRNRALTSADIGTFAGSVLTQAEVLPSGTLGWSVRPQASLSMLGRYGIALVALLFLTFRALLDPTRMGWALLFDGVAVLLLAITLMLFFRNSKVVADRQHVGKTNLFGRTKSLALSEVTRAERFSVSSQGLIKHLVFVGTDGRKAFEVAGPAWDFDRLDALCQEAGIPLSGSYDDLVSAFKLNQRVPGTTKWSQQLLIGLAVILVMIPTLFLVIGPTQR